MSDILDPVEFGHHLFFFHLVLLILFSFVNFILFELFLNFVDFLVEKSSDIALLFDQDL